MFFSEGVVVVYFVNTFYSNLDHNKKQNHKAINHNINVLTLKILKKVVLDHSHLNRIDVYVKVNRGVKFYININVDVIFNIPDCFDSV